LIDVKTIGSISGRRLGQMILLINSHFLNQMINPDVDLKKKPNQPYTIVTDKNLRVQITPVNEDVGVSLTQLMNRQAKDITKDLSKENQNFSANYKGQNVLVTFSYDDQREWYLMSVAPKSYLFAESAQMGAWVIVVVLVIAILATLVSFGVALSISKPLNQVLQAMKKASEGDLTVQVHLESKDELGYLGTGFNVMIGKIKGLLMDTRKAMGALIEQGKELGEASAQSAHSAEMVASAMTDITRGTVEQTSESERTSERMNGLAKQIDETVTASDEVQQVTGFTRNLSINSKETIRSLGERADDTKTITREIIGNIDQLNTSASAIRNITQLIENIAEQTNLLALNAAIEAARAGEAGTGFAVVAQEVDKLSVRSREAARTINQLLKQIQVHTTSSTSTASKALTVVEEQLRAVAATQQSFEDITKAMNYVAQRIEEVGQKVQQINTVKELTLQSVMNISAISEETVAAAEEVSASSEEQTAVAERVNKMANELRQLSENLAKTISIFKV
jgi:methyl-accepting chemotaxis protein